MTLKNHMSFDFTFLATWGLKDLTLERPSEKLTTLNFTEKVRGCIMLGS